MRTTIIPWYHDLGEVLFFKRPAEKLQVEVTTDKEQYTPGETVEFEVTVRDQNGEIVEGEAFVSVFVTDESVFSKLD